MGGRRRRRHERGHVLAIESERPAAVGHVFERGRSATFAIGLGEVAAGRAQEREPAGPRLEVGERARPELAREAGQLPLLGRGRLRRLADVEVGQRRMDRLDHGTRGSDAAEQRGDGDGQDHGHRRAGPRRSHGANPRRDPIVRKLFEDFDWPRSTLRAVSTETRERTARANGIEIAYDELGDPDGEPVLLIMGLATQMIHWDEGFCGLLGEPRLPRDPLRQPRRRPLEQDRRGRSPGYGRDAARRGRPAYTLRDMAADTVGAARRARDRARARRRRLDGRDDRPGDRDRPPRAGARR